MVDAKAKRVQHEKRHYRVRNRVKGTSERPRLAVYRSLKNIYAQVIDDVACRTLAAAGTMSPELRGRGKCKKSEAAKAVGKLIAQKALAAGITKVSFDRGGYKFHGRVKALADAAREAGLKF